MRSIFFAAVAAIVLAVFPSGVFAQDTLSHSVYTDVRYVHDGEARLNVTNNTEVGAGYINFTSGQGVLIDGRFRISDWPLSIGARFDWISGEWTSRDRIQFGPSVQLRWGAQGSWDLSLRLDLLIDCQEGDMGAIELRTQYVRNIGHVQLIPLVRLTFQGEDELPEYSAPWETQLTVQFEISGYWPNWTYLRPLFRVENTNWWQFGGESRGFVSLEVGVKGEWRATSFMSIWYQLAGGYVRYYGDGFQQCEHGGRILGSIGGAFHR